MGMDRVTRDSILAAIDLLTLRLRGEEAAAAACRTGLAVLREEQVRA